MAQCVVRRARGPALPWTCPSLLVQPRGLAAGNEGRSCLEATSFTGVPAWLPTCPATRRDDDPEEEAAQKDRLIQVPAPQLPCRCLPSPRPLLPHAAHAGRVLAADLHTGSHLNQQTPPRSGRTGRCGVMFHTWTPCAVPLLPVQQIYNRRLDERERRRQFVLDRGLLNIKRQQVRGSAAQGRACGGGSFGACLGACISRAAASCTPPGAMCTGGAPPGGLPPSP